MSSIATKPLIGSESNECALCELSNDVEYWDTGRYLDLSVPDKHNGRKYVCRDCIQEAAKLFEFLPPKEAQEIKDEIAYLKDRVLHLTKVADLVQAVKDAEKVIAAGYPGLAAAAKEPVQESKPAKSVKGAKIIRTVTPEAGVTENGAEPAATVKTV